MSNIDAQELAKFNAAATRWWDPQGDYRTLHDINPLRLGFIQQSVDLKHKKVLDVGCGGGILAEAMARAGAHVTGIDLSEPLIKTAQLHLLESRLPVEYHTISAEDMAQKHAQAFDVVTCLEMLEHVPEPQSSIKACAALVKPGGHVFFSTLNRNMKAYLFAILGAEYILNMLPRGTHDYAKFIRPSELDSWASTHGLEMLAMKGMGYNPLSKQYFLSNDVSVNYLVHCKKRPSL
jgi:2-polyprenyl-6-hydroxyphenyl methylase/3-demethylubiquinone-9 3-methyltransferase